MRINHRIYKSLRLICVLLLGVSFTVAVDAQRKTEKSARTISVGLRVVDDTGAPVTKAKVVIGEGVIHAVTDENGAYSLTAYPADIITITAPGFEKSVSLVQDLLKEGVIKLTSRSCT